MKTRSRGICEELIKIVSYSCKVNVYLNGEVDVAARLGVNVNLGADLALLNILQLEALVLLRVLVDLRAGRFVCVRLQVRIHLSLPEVVVLDEVEDLLRHVLELDRHLLVVDVELHTTVNVMRR